MEHAQASLLNLDQVEHHLYKGQYLKGTTSHSETLETEDLDFALISTFYQFNNSRVLALSVPCMVSQH